MRSAMCPIFAFGARFGQAALHPRAKPRARYVRPCVHVVTRICLQLLC